MRGKIEIKPLSVNEIWKGKRFKTDKYLIYERNLLLLLPDCKIENKPLKLSLYFGFSSLLSDIDNPVKPFIDVLQKKYGINDKLIYELHIKKVIVPKGDEFIDFEFEYVK